MSVNDGYNITHSNKGLSFENCLMDAMMLFEEGEAIQLLVGAVEEISAAQFRIESLAGHVKNEKDAAQPLYKNDTSGSVAGEGAAMFLVAEAKENAVAEIVDVEMISNPTVAEVHTTLQNLLAQNSLEKNEIDAMVIGLSGDSNTDHYYTSLMDEMEKETAMFSFKNLFGESPSASAFATWLGAQILSGNTAPEIVVIKPTTKLLKTLVIYNHFQGGQHGFILLKAV